VKILRLSPEFWNTTPQLKSQWRWSNLTRVPVALLQRDYITAFNFFSHAAFGNSANAPSIMIGEKAADLMQTPNG
jgi:hypothetical protein